MIQSKQLKMQVRDSNQRCVAMLLQHDGGMIGMIGIIGIITSWCRSHHGREQGRDEVQRCLDIIGGKRPPSPGLLGSQVLKLLVQA